MRMWHGVFHCFSRQEQHTARVKHEFPDGEKPEVVMAVLAQGAYFNIDEAVKEYEEFLKSPDDGLFFLGECENPTRIEAGGEGYWATGEEWNGGIGLTPEAASIAFVESMPGS